MAQTLIACLPQLFQPHSRVPNEKYFLPADIIVFGISFSDFLFYVVNGMCIH